MLLEPITLSLIFLEAELWAKIEYFDVYFENDVTQVIHPNMAMVAYIFYAEGDFRNEIR